MSANRLVLLAACALVAGAARAQFHSLFGGGRREPSDTSSVTVPPSSSRPGTRTPVTVPRGRPVCDAVTESTL